MKTFFNTKKAAKDVADQLQLKGRSKVETKKDLFKLMKEQGCDAEQKQIVNIERRLTNLIKSTAKKIENLGYPDKPLKGRGHERDEWVNHNTLEVFNKHIVKGNIDYVYFRSSGGHFNHSAVISLQLSKLFNAYENKIETLKKELDGIKSEAVIEAERLAKEKAEREIIEQKAAQEKMFKNLNADEVFAKFFAFETHPAPSSVYDLKKATGMSWNKLREKYKK